MIKIFFRYIIYSLLDFLYLFKNYFLKNNFIIISPRIISIIVKKILIYDKNNRNFFFQNIRNYSDILTVHEIFSSEHYNFKNFKIFKDIQSYYKYTLNKNFSPLIIDCGSNIGSSSTYFDRLFPSSKLISIEPDLESYEFSKSNSLNKNSFFINKAVSCENLELKFLSDKDDNRASKVSDKGDKIVSSITINEILKNDKFKNSLPFLIKIDIEGFEDNLFSKNFEWIDEFKIIIIELHDWMLEKKSNSFTFFCAITKVMREKHKRDFLILGENLISIRIDD